MGKLREIVVLEKKKKTLNLFNKYVEEITIERGF